MWRTFREATTSRFLPLWRLEVLTREAETPQLLWVDSGLRDRIAATEPPTLLGLAGGVAHFAVDLSDLTDPIGELGLDGARFSDVRGIAPFLGNGDSGILAQARAAVDWHRRHRFCGVCGAPTLPEKGGSSRRCSVCAAEHFPRTDPVVIMVVWSGDRCLLGKRPGRGTGMYSAFAGFIEQGETIEEAVRREVEEEVGLAVDEVVYHSSQPWPFPSSLMIGCFAHVAPGEIHLDAEEIEDARWLSRDELRRYYADPSGSNIAIPGPIAIAHHIIRAWAEQEA